MAKKKIYIFGSGGHAKSCIETITSNKDFQIEGIVCLNTLSKDKFFSQYNRVLMKKN
tara:strand:+ start:108 stop:278 length:171 start_codon:yes stop_codon:yes gene_type:complete